MQVMQVLFSRWDVQAPLYQLYDQCCKMFVVFQQPACISKCLLLQLLVITCSRHMCVNLRFPPMFDSPQSEGMPEGGHVCHNSHWLENGGIIDVLG